MQKRKSKCFLIKYGKIILNDGMWHNIYVKNVKMIIDKNRINGNMEDYVPFSYFIQFQNSRRHLQVFFRRSKKRWQNLRMEIALAGVGCGFWDRLFRSIWVDFALPFLTLAVERAFCVIRKFATGENAEKQRKKQKLFF